MSFTPSPMIKVVDAAGKLDPHKTDAIEKARRAIVKTIAAEALACSASSTDRSFIIGCALAGALATIVTSDPAAAAVARDLEPRLRNGMIAQVTEEASTATKN